MGIRGLSTFVDLNHKLLSEHKLHDTRVVIDGNNLYHFLWNHYRVSQQFGGDYDHYARKCKLFFNILNMCHVKPYVVFDGGYDPDDRKLPTILERMRKRLLSAKTISRNGIGNLMPILAQATFFQVLVELGIPHVSCQYEADREIAVLANKWQCPVMSNDSDFFVFGLEGGFMPFDYVNLTLCVCDSETGDSSVMELDEALTEHQFVYIPVKLYKYDRFVKYYGKNMERHILPVFATVLGNDYIDTKLLEGFYAQLHVPKKNNQKFSVPKLNTRMLAVLKWLDSVKDIEKCIHNVLIHLPKEKRNDIQKLMINSIKGYSDIEKFLDLDLREFFESLDQNIQPREEMFPELRDFYSNILPNWFVIGSRKCVIAGNVQNVAVLHRTIRLCQVETLSEPSTYSCCRHITAVICSLLFGQYTLDEKLDVTKRNCLVEYDRDQLNIKKVLVKPVESVEGFTPLPSLHTLINLSKEERFKFIMCSLGLTEDFIVKQKSLPPFSVLLVSILSHWIRNASPKVTLHHLHSLLIGVITLHTRSLKWLDQKLARGGSPVIPSVSEEIKTAYAKATEKQRDKYLANVEKFFKNPEHSVKNPRENLVIHGFSQFQACLYETLNLNQVLMMPTEPPSPSLILNCTFVYNLCRDLQNRVNPDLFVTELLIAQSPFHELFLTLKNVVWDICGSTSFSMISSAVPSQRKSKSKGKKSKKREKKDSISDCDETEEEHMVVNCDISNKFSMLNMNE